MVVGQGCRAGNPDGERIHGAGCQPGDASAWAYLRPEVSRRAGRMPGSRSRMVCLGRTGSRKPGRRCAFRNPGPQTYFRLALGDSATFLGCVGQMEAPWTRIREFWLLVLPLLLTCGLTRNPADSKLTLDYLGLAVRHSPNHYSL